MVKEQELFKNKKKERSEEKFWGLITFPNKQAKGYWLTPIRIWDMGDAGKGITIHLLSPYISIFKFMTSLFNL